MPKKYLYIPVKLFIGEESRPSEGTGEPSCFCSQVFFYRHCFEASARQNSTSVCGLSVPIIRPAKQ